MPPPVDVQIAPSSVLDDLLARRHDAKVREDEAIARRKEFDTKLGNELVNSNPPGTAVFNIPAMHGGPALRFYWATPLYFPTKEFRKENPGMYDRYARRKGYWTFGVVRGNTSE
jgi:hypothetical protein